MEETERCYVERERTLDSHTYRRFTRFAPPTSEFLRSPLFRSTNDPKLYDPAEFPGFALSLGIFDLGNSLADRAIQQFSCLRRRPRSLIVPKSSRSRVELRRCSKQSGELWLTLPNRKRGRMISTQRSCPILSEKIMTLRPMCLPN